MQSNANRTTANGSAHNVRSGCYLNMPTAFPIQREASASRHIMAIILREIIVADECLSLDVLSGPDHQFH